MDLPLRLHQRFMANILFTRFPLQSAYGGAEIQTLSLMKGLKEKGHEMQFMGSCKVLLEQAKDLGIRTWDLGIGNPPVTKWDAISFLWRQKSMKSELLGQFNLLSSTFHLQAVLMLSLSEKILITEDLAKAGTKVFWIEHDRVGRWLKKNPWLGALKRASKFATIICVSELSRKMYIELGFDADRVIAIPNGIDLARFNAHQNSSSNHHATQKSTIHLGCIARLSPEKGIDVLLNAVSDIPEIDLTVMGTGPEHGFLLKMIDTFEERIPGTKQRMKIMQHIDDLGAFYASLDAFVLPSSDHDPFGLVAAEAMSVGVPTIVTDACGIAGYMKDGEDAVIVKAGDMNALKEGIRKLLDADVRERIREAGKRVAKNLFSAERMIQAYEKIIAG